MPAPMPVPRATSITSRYPRAAPNLASAQAEAFASFSTTTSRPRRSSTLCFSGSSRQARFGANSMVARELSTNPAAPSPMALTRRPCSSSVTTSAMACSVSAGLAAGVDLRSFATIRPFSSTTPAATLVPPTSTPIARVTVLSRGDRPPRAWGDCPPPRCPRTLLEGGLPRWQAYRDRQASPGGRAFRGGPRFQGGQAFRGAPGFEGGLRLEGGRGCLEARGGCLGGVEPPAVRRIDFDLGSL